jgi:hypothetical protein
MSPMSEKPRLLNASSVAPSESTITFPGWPLPCVSLYMPLTNASITVLSPITSVNASAVMIVVRHRTCRFRRL